MATSNKIVTTELDFDGIKTSLKQYLQGQQKFTDYDFEGSGLSILLDILAYNTHYMALYDNLAINEAFLDSASKRTSVVSKAKELGYVPTSVRAATANVKIVMINDDVSAPTTNQISKNDKFTTAVDGVAYTFYSQGDYIATKSGNLYTFDNVEIKEGVLVTNTFVANGTSAKFVIPNSKIDTSTLVVTVQENSGSSTSDTYTASSSLLEVTGTTLVYFLNELDNEFYELEFGNGVVGKQLSAGNVVTVTYLVPNEDAPNGARVFTYAETPPSNTEVFVSTVSVAYGGAAAETVDDIKWNAPRVYSAQNRLVTTEDYRTIINSEYPNADSINVWGGELANPPQYGTVFIAIKPSDDEILTEAAKQYILNDIIEPRRCISTFPEIVDPVYLYVEMKCNFYYNPNETTRTALELSNLVRSAILDYNNTNLSKFGGILKYSTLLGEVDDAEESIKNSIVTLKLQRVVTPVYNVSTNYVVDIGNPIYNSGQPEQSVLSNGFTVLNSSQTIYIEDVPAENSTVGTLRLFYYNTGNEKVVVRENTGSVDYDTGVITINNLIITGINDSDFRLIVKPQSNDVASSRNQIVDIPTELLTVTAVVDKAADKYSFTSSRN